MESGPEFNGEKGEDAGMGTINNEDDPEEE
jgi:hypothetical protein